MLLDLQTAFKVTGGFGIFQVLVCITGSIACCFAGSVFSAGAFNNLVTCSINASANANLSSPSYISNHDFKTSISVTYHLCDDRASFGELSSVLLLAGCIPGSLLAGPAADILGRLPAVLIGLLGSVATNIAATFLPYFWLHLTSRAICGFFISWVLGSIYVYGNEVLLTEHRARFVKLFNLGPSIGSIILAGLAYYTRDYKGLMTANNFIVLPMALIVSFLPESPSWLITQGSSRERVRRALCRIACLNRHSPSQVTNASYLATIPSGRSLESQLPMSHSEPRDPMFQSLRVALKSLLSDRSAIAQLLTTCLYGFSSGFSYYGFTFVMTHALPNIYITLALMGVVEASSLLLLDTFSRGRTLFLSAIGTAAFCFAIGAIFAYLPPNEIGSVMSAVLVGLAIGGKFVSNIAFCAIVAMGAELYPTAVRNTGLGLLMSAVRVGCMVSPFVNFIPHLSARFAAIGLPCLLAAFPVRSLPDTRKKDLML